MSIIELIFGVFCMGKKISVTSDNYISMIESDHALWEKTKQILIWVINSKIKNIITWFSNDGTDWLKENEQVVQEIETIAISWTTFKLIYDGLNLRLSEILWEGMDLGEFKNRSLDQLKIEHIRFSWFIINFHKYINETINLKIPEKVDFSLYWFVPRVLVWRVIDELFVIITTKIFSSYNWPDFAIDVSDINVNWCDFESFRLEYCKRFESAWFCDLVDSHQLKKIEAYYELLFDSLDKLSKKETNEIITELFHYFSDTKVPLYDFYWNIEGEKVFFNELFGIIYSHLKERCWKEV
jgi:hypothetical protein